jgi:transcriptional regulator with XRE-family HTH domain
LNQSDHPIAHRPPDRVNVLGLAKKAGVSAMTVTRFENGHSAGYPETLEKLEKALRKAGVEFTDGDQPGVRLKGVPRGGMSVEDLNASNDE